VGNDTLLVFKGAMAIEMGGKMSMDETDHLKDQLVQRYREYLKGCSMKELTDKLDWLAISAEDGDSLKSINIVMLSGVLN